jgi:gas vesicle protein
MEILMMKNYLLTFVTGFCIGAATGSAFALLNAPQSGMKTRVKIMRGIEDARARTEEVLADAQESARLKLDEIQHQANQVVKNVSGQVKHLQEA